MVKKANAFFGSGLKTCITKRQQRSRVCLWFLILIFLPTSGSKRHKLGSSYSSSASAWEASNFQCPEHNPTTLSVDQVASFSSEILKHSGDIGWMTMFACIKEGACPSGTPAQLLLMAWHLATWGQLKREAPNLRPFDGLTGISWQLWQKESGDRWNLLLWMSIFMLYDHRRLLMNLQFKNEPWNAAIA